MNGPKNAKIYSRNIPEHYIRFLVRIGNAQNNIATITTVLEKWVGPGQLEPAWKIKAAPQCSKIKA